MPLAIGTTIGLVVSLAVLSYLHTGSGPEVPEDVETGARPVFTAVLRSLDEGTPLTEALRAAPVQPQVRKKTKEPECAVLYRWVFTTSGSEVGWICVDAAGKVTSVGGGMRFNLRSY